MAKDMKTTQTEKSAVDFINSVENEQKQKDCFALMGLMEKITGEPAKMWGPSIVGFGTYHYKYASGREGDFLTVGFSPRKTALTLYIMSGFSKYDDLMNNLGKFKTGKSCLYIKRLADLNIDVLTELISESVTYIKNKKWP